ncbi:MAG TPA: CDP-alcohol phosphatidyltransferase family protein [Steroidobacteraceae bacterium]|nr:CDP-alcohol phosphatidyltransferase family protein [Steroidobacteraceae bacterium]
MICILTAALVVVVTALAGSHAFGLSAAYVPKVMAVLALGALLVWRGLPGHHPFAQFGPANQLTLARGALVALLAGLIGEGGGAELAALTLALGTVVAVLDRLDGWLARRTRMAGAFGARFDMETDAALIMVLALLAWQFGKSGAWVLASGLLRYVFIAAGMAMSWMRRPLPPSQRRKVVAVIQVVALLACVAPIIPTSVSVALAAAGLGTLTLSFAVDVIWLCRRATALERRHAGQALGVLLALVVLNASVTFHNVWPTLGVHWPGELSVEFSVLLLGLALSNAWLGRTRPGVLALLSALIVVFALGRYAYVTVQALYGRDINLYWDGPQLGAVIGMFVRVASPWAVAAVCLGTIGVLAVLYVAARWSLGQIDRALREYGAARWSCGAAALLLVAYFFAQQNLDAVPSVPRFSIPVSRTFMAQVARVADAVSGRPNQGVPPSPSMRSSFAALGGSDVLLIFIESYGSTTYDRPEFERALRPARARLAAAIQDTGRGVVSAYVSSPTFGGGSVLAHLSLLSGIEVRDPDHYALLMTQKRPTLVSLFKSAGYRAVAVMPGLRESWPEGVFYGFDKIYGADGLDYQGPAFGWWRIPDQFSLAALDSRELQPRPRKPVFVFFPTVSTHMPFEPTPPLQSDWQRVLTANPYDAEPLRRALTRTPVWTDMGKAYVSSVQYFLDTLSSYLRARPDAKFVLILLGDHQPAANVSGEDASWDVPVHVIASQPAILRALQADGFRPGLTPVRPAAGKMSALGPWSLTAFGKP